MKDRTDSSFSWLLFLDWGSENVEVIYLCLLLLSADLPNRRYLGKSRRIDRLEVMCVP